MDMQQWICRNGYTIVYICQRGIMSQNNVTAHLFMTGYTVFYVP